MKIQYWIIIFGIIISVLLGIGLNQRVECLEKTGGEIKACFFVGR